MRKQIKIFEESTVRQALKDVFAAGFRPATIEEIYALKKKGKIPDQWYDTGTLWYCGKFAQFNKRQLPFLDEIYRSEGRLLFLGDTDVGLGGYGSLAYNGRFVGVAAEPQKKEGVSRGQKA